MYMFMHHQHALFQEQLRAEKMCEARGVYPFQSVTGVDPNGYPIPAQLWMVEADQMLCLVERLAVLGIPISL